MRWILASSVALAVIAFACGNDADTPAASRTPSPRPAPASPLPTDTPTPTASPAPTPIVTEAPGPPLNVSSLTRIIYTTHGSIDGATFGPLRVADLAGHTAPLTPDGVNASFVGLSGDPLTSDALVYYIADITDDSAIMYVRQLPDGEPQRIAHIRPWFSRLANGALSPDGRYIAYTDQYGIELLDLQTHEFRLITSSGGDKDKCKAQLPEPGSLGACTAFSSPRWSPDGKLLSVGKGYWEGGDHWMVDPFTPGSTPLPAGHCCGGQWSPTSDAICTWGDYGGYTPLFVNRAPDWTDEPHGQTSDDYQDPNRLQVNGCSWLDDKRVALAVIANESYPAPPSSWVEVIDLSTDARTRVGTTSLGEQCCGRPVFAIPGAGLVLTQYFIQNANSNISQSAQPIAIDTKTDTSYSVLQPGDIIVGVVTP